MVRRIAAVLGIFLLLVVVAGLMYRVWLHHESAGRYTEETDVVWLSNCASFSLRPA